MPCRLCGTLEHNAMLMKISKFLENLESKIFEKKIISSRTKEMLELFAANAVINTKKDDDAKGGNVNGGGQVDEAAKRAWTITMVIYLAILAFAIYRAINCSAVSGNLKGLNFIAAVTSPVLYLIVSFATTGFCSL